MKGRPPEPSRTVAPTPPAALTAELRSRLNPKRTLVSGFSCGSIMALRCAAGDESAALQDEIEHLREMYLRKLAEFDNYRKRTEREKAELVKLAGAEILHDLIPVLDNFERADRESFAEITSRFRYWKSIETHYGGECVVSTGHGFAALSRKIGRHWGEPGLRARVTARQTDRIPRLRPRGWVAPRHGVHHAGDGEHDTRA